ISIDNKTEDEVLKEIKEVSHPSWRFGETIKQKEVMKKEKARTTKKLDDIIEWLEALEERIEFLEARL
ncbi:MAG: hypothetical protein RMJ31_07725, partial [Nitrososphaerota archaeon]|nr:hypothetical protein [Nitrososphaerota archaeon]